MENAIEFRTFSFLANLMEAYYDYCDDCEKKGITPLEPEKWYENLF